MQLLVEELMVGKKIKGRKRHIVTDSQGHILNIKVHAANEHDTTVGYKIFEETLEKYPSLQGAYLDAGYRKTTENYIRDILKKIVTTSKKIAPGWDILPVRWVVERTFGWFNGFRRLSKDYEISIASAENFIRIAHIAILLPRIN
jgi:putative transposase